MTEPSRNVRGVPYGCPLSPREYEIVSGLAESQTYAQIGLDLGISESAVRSHITRIYSRLGVVDRAQAVIKCWQQGWILIAGTVPVKMGDTPPDPELSPEVHDYLVAFMRWLKAPTEENFLKRREALDRMGVSDVTGN